MWRSHVFVALISLLLTGCYWRAGKGIWLPAARPVPDAGTATLTVINNDDRPLFLYRSDGREVLELLVPPRGSWRIPDLAGEWWFRFVRMPIHVPHIDVYGQVQGWPPGSRLRLERQWDYTVVVGSGLLSWTMSRWVYPPVHWTQPAEE